MGKRFHIRIIIAAAIVLCAAASLFGQTKTPPSGGNFTGARIVMDRFGRSPVSIRFPEGRQPGVASFFQEYRELFSLSPDHQFRLRQTLTDRSGQTHYRFDQYYKGVQVLGGEYLLHERAGRVFYANGLLVHGLEAEVAPLLSETEALQAALRDVGAESYFWESEANEAFLKKEQGDPKATFYPSGELKLACGYAEMLPGNFRLAYRFDIYAENPLGRYYVDVDARSGEILAKYPRIHDADVAGTGTSLYNGTVNIIVDSFAGGYRLREAGRSGVQTYNMQNGTNYGAAVDFVDSDVNFTAAVAHAGVSAHWGAEATYDYYLYEHGRNSYNNAGGILRSYVHYGNNYNNAFWDGTRMTYGDGNGVTFSPLVSLDVTGHEITHGVTEYSADLVYANESGALNESFSDIFGTAIEFYIEGAAGDWLIGEDIYLAGPALRSMENPNSAGDPDTYFGNFWAPLASSPNQFNDYGGVHSNSGVQNFWFYLLSEGSSGVNDNGDAYSVSGIGIDDAAQIVYRNLTVYLTSNSRFIDARNGSINAAEDLFGDPSPQLQAVKDAWDAVGVYGPPAPPEIELSPLSFEFILEPDATASASLAISNLAQGRAQVLNWWAGEQDVTLALSSARTLLKPAQLSPENGATVVFAEEEAYPAKALPVHYPLFDESARDESPAAVVKPGATLSPAYPPIYSPVFPFTEYILYDNGPLANSAGSGVGGADESILQNVSLGMTTLGLGHQFSADNRIADDFTISNPGGWSVDSLVFFAYQTGSSTTSTITGVYYQIWNGDPRNPGSSVVFGNLTTNRLINTRWANLYRVDENTMRVAANRPVMASTASAGFTLTPGTYWIVWKCAGSLASGPWAPPITVTGQAVTGNGLQYTGGVWQNALDGGALTQQGFPFLIYGSSGDDCPWLSVTPFSGAVPPGGGANASLNIDAAALSPGTYICNVLISNNDPDETQLTVPVQLIVTNGLAANLKIFLEGPYNNGSMSSYLGDNARLPLSQPFGGAPWNHGGSESVASIPPGVTDWVLLELRGNSPSFEKKISRAAFIESSGAVVDLDGVSPVRFLYPPGSYYLVVRHRNHLAIMSANPVPLSESSALYDFTAAPSQAYGTNPMKLLGGGVYGMIAGDGNSDGSVNITDREDVWRAQNGAEWDYLKFGDFNLDGGIDARDLNFFWRPDSGSVTQAP